MAFNSGCGPRLAIFDCDGTIVDSQRSIVLSMRTAFERHDLPPPEADAVRRMVGLPLFDAIARLLPADTPEDRAAPLTEAYKVAFTELRQGNAVHEPLYPGAREAIETLDDKGWLLGIATGKGRRGLDNTLNTHGLTGRFTTVQTADVAAGKPHPEMVLRAMAETGTDAEATVMIGDTTYDMEMARAAGVVAIGVAWGYHEAEELTAAGASVVLREFRELVNVIEP